MKKFVFDGNDVVEEFRTVDRGRGSVSGKMKLALAEEIERFIKTEKPKIEATRSTSFAWASFAARYIKEWDVADRDGKPLPIDPETIVKLPDSIQSQFKDIVTGYAEPVFPTPSDASASS